MKTRLNVFIFLIIIIAALYMTRSYWEGWIVGAISIAFTLSVIFIAIVIFFENRHPTTTLTWLLVLAAFPMLGFFFYLLFGQNIRKKRTFSKKAIKDEQVFQVIEGERTLKVEQFKKMGEHQKLLFQLAHRLGKTPVSFATETKVLTDGKETFAHILQSLRLAKHHIHLEYYIVRHDKIGEEIKEILIEKANTGVEVRFLYDAVGSWRLARSYIEDLRKAGIKTEAFSPVKFPILNHKINYRNHRKIIVIDGVIGFVGGLNIGDEYLGRHSYFGLWRDTHLFVKGESVRDLQLIFLQDWYYVTNESIVTPTYLPPVSPHQKGDGGVQMIASGPDARWEINKKLFSQ